MKILDTILDKESGIPIHHQIYCHIKDQIISGELKAYSVLPSENAMQELYGVSRITVRRAVGDLAHDGYLRKSHGKGTIVLPQKETSNVNHLVSFSEGAKMQGDIPSAVVLRQQIVRANVKVAESLQVDLDEEVLFLKRLRLLNGVLVGIQNAYITGRKELLSHIPAFDEKTSLYDILSTCGIELDSADEVIEAMLPSPELRRELFMEDHEPVLLREAISYDADGTPIEYSENFYIASRYKYCIHYKRGAGISMEESI